MRCAFAYASCRTPVTCHDTRTPGRLVRMVKRLFAISFQSRACVSHGAWAEDRHVIPGAVQGLEPFRKLDRRKSSAIRPDDAVVDVHHLGRLDERVLQVLVRGVERMVDPERACALRQRARDVHVPGEVAGVRRALAVDAVARSGASATPDGVRARARPQAEGADDGAAVARAGPPIPPAACPSTARPVLEVPATPGPDADLPATPAPDSDEPKTPVRSVEQPATPAAPRQVSAAPVRPTTAAVYTTVAVPINAVPGLAPVLASTRTFGVAVPIPISRLLVTRNASSLFDLKTRGFASVVPRKSVGAFVPALPVSFQTAVGVPEDGITDAGNRP
jgi:hypothetical protein